MLQDHVLRQCVSRIWSFWRACDCRERARCLGRWLRSLLLIANHESSILPCSKAFRSKASFRMPSPGVLHLVRSHAAVQARHGLAFAC